jgi:hypothetical protein
VSGEEAPKDAPEGSLALGLLRLAVVLGILGVVVGWPISRLLHAQKVTDDGDRIVVFNNAPAAVSLEVDGETHRLAPRETWRSEALDEGPHVLRIDARPFEVKTAFEGATALVPVVAAPLGVVDVAGRYVGGASGRTKLLSTHAAGAPVRAPRRWVLSPYEPLPAVLYGSPPLKAIFIEEADVADASGLARRIEEGMGAAR